MSAGRTMNVNWTLTSNRWVKGSAPTRVRIVAQLELSLEDAELSSRRGDAERSPALRSPVSRRGDAERLPALRSTW